MALTGGSGEASLLCEAGPGHQQLQSWALRETKNMPSDAMSSCNLEQLNSCPGGHGTGVGGCEPEGNTAGSS